MQLRSIVCLGLALVAAGTTKAEAANFFSYGLHEQEVYHSIFDHSDGWQLNSTSVDNGELHGNLNSPWASAEYDLSSLNGLDLDQGEIVIYWSARTDRTKPEKGKFYMELNVIPTDTQEARHISWNIRPVAPSNGNFANLPYLLYLDPGFNIPYEQEAELVVPDQFPDTQTYENFRFTLKKTDSDTVVVNPYYWANDSWQAFLPHGDSKLPLTLSITNNLAGRDYFESLSFRFRTDRSFLDAVAITQILTGATTHRQPQPIPIPESSMVFGLLALGAWRTGRLRKIKSSSVKILRLKVCEGRELHREYLPSQS